MITPLEETVLIVDDEAITLLSISEMLKSEGYRVFQASNGLDAIEILKKNKIDLILSDYKLPDKEGIEVLKEAKLLSPESVCILITAYADKEMAVKAINIGQVSYFISKPWDNEQVCQIIKVSLEKVALQKEMKAMQELVMENHRELAKSHKNLKNQLDIGSKIHETLLLGQIPDDLQGISISFKAFSSQEIDGDFFEFYRPLPYIVDLVLGDVMGKGIPAALVATAVKTHLIRFAVPIKHPFIFDKKSWWKEDLLPVESIVSKVHESIVSDLIKLEYFVSLIYARLDLKKRVLSWVDCGFMKPIHWKSDEKKAVLLKSEGYPLGMIENGIYVESTVPFKEKDLFIFYSDGVAEAKSSGKELFDSKRLLALVEQIADKTPEEISQSIKQEVIKFQGKDRFDDDFSLIILKIDKYIEIENHSKGKGQFSADMAQLKAVRDFVGRAARDLPGDYESIGHDLKLAINEIFCNIVKHGYRTGTYKPILIEIEPDADGVKVNISDKGNPFDPHKITEPSLFGDRDDGFGWYLIRQLVEQVVYVPKTIDEGWNHLSLYKKYCYEEESMDIIHTADQDVLVITPMGDSLDAKETPEFKEEVLKLIDENESKYVIFDLKELQFVDSSGLGSFLSILRRLNAEGGDLKLCNMSKSVRSMFELVSMHRIFDIVATVDEAKKTRNSAKKL